jgi:hypothetical protein
MEADSLWVADCMNVLWDNMPHHARDDRLYESCKNNLVAVNTAVGQTERVDIP